MIRAKRDIRPSEWVLGVVLSLLVAAALVYGVALGITIPAGMAAVVLALLSVLIATRSLGACRASLRAGGGFSRLGSAVFGAGIVIAVILPGAQLALGTRKSRLDDTGFATQDVGHALTLAFLIFTMALVAFWVGELLAEGRKPGSEGTVTDRPIGRPWESKATYWFLLVVGVALIIAAIGSDFSQRGRVTGQGVIQLFAYSAPLAVAVGLLNRHWGSRFLAAVSLGLMTFMVLQGIRTPLLIVAAAAGVRYVHSTANRQFGPRQILVIVLAIYVGAVMLVSLSAWRGQKNTGGDLGLPEIIVLAAQDPFVHLQEQGLDTVDGLILATKVDPQLAGATVTDPLKVVTGFIPHQIWPNKPPWLSAEVTQAYTNFGAGGIFLSGAGYTLIVFRTAAAVPILFLLLGFFCERIFRRMTQPSIWTALLVYFLVRWYFAGDAFDANHVLGLCIVVLTARGFSALLELRHRPAVIEPGGQREAYARSTTA
ncbi:MAG TPA: hypothetical protein VH391_10910 [Solirubrobacterales bacterium]